MSSHGWTEVIILRNPVFASRAVMPDQSILSCFLVPALILAVVEAPAQVSLHTPALQQQNSNYDGFAESLPRHYDVEYVYHVHVIRCVSNTGIITRVNECWVANITI